MCQGQSLRMAVYIIFGMLSHGLCRFVDEVKARELEPADYGGGVGWFDGGGSREEEDYVATAQALVQPVDRVNVQYMRLRAREWAKIIRWVNEGGLSEYL